MNTPREGVARSRRRVARKPITSVLFTLGRYDTLKPASLLALVRDVASVPDQQQWPAAAACDGLLRMGAALWQRTQGPGRAPSAEVEARFVNASLCRLLTFLSLALTGTVAVEDAESFDAKLDAWRALLTAFGLGRPHLCALP